MKSGLIVAALIAAAVAIAAMPDRSSSEDPSQPAPDAEGRKSQPLQEAEQAILDALRRTLELLQHTFDTVIIYELPEILPNGDIIISRRQPQAEPVKPPPDAEEPVQL
jgi:hypothetical protein